MAVDFPLVAVSNIKDSAWKTLLASFREKPGVVNAAAIAAGVKWGKAHEAWDRGFPYREPPLKPIRVILAEEAAAKEAKASVIRTETEAFAAAIRGEVREDALNVHELEGKLVKSARTQVGNLHAVAGRAGILADKLVRSLEADLAKEGALDALSPEKKAALADRLTIIKERAIKMTKEALEVERQWRGDPTKVIGLVPMEQMSPEEAARLAREAYEAALEYERHGLTIIDGGREPGPIVQLPTTASASS